MPCPGHCCLRQTPEIETNGTQGQTLISDPARPPYVSDLVPCMSNLSDDFQISTSPSKDKDLLAGGFSKEFAEGNSKRGVVKPF